MSSHVPVGILIECRWCSAESSTSVVRSASLIRMSCGMGVWHGELQGAEVVSWTSSALSESDSLWLLRVCCWYASEGDIDKYGPFFKDDRSLLSDIRTGCCRLSTCAENWRGVWGSWNVTCCLVSGLMSRYISRSSFWYLGMSSCIGCCPLPPLLLIIPVSRRFLMWEEEDVEQFSNLRRWVAMLDMLFSLVIFARFSEISLFFCSRCLMLYVAELFRRTFSRAVADRFSGDTKEAEGSRIESSDCRISGSIFTPYLVGVSRDFWSWLSRSAFNSNGCRCLHKDWKTNKWTRTLRQQIVSSIQMLENMNLNDISTDMFLLVNMFSWRLFSLDFGFLLHLWRHIVRLDLFTLSATSTVVGGDLPKSSWLSLILMLSLCIARCLGDRDWSRAVKTFFNSGRFDGVRVIVCWKMENHYNNLNIYDFMLLYPKKSIHTFIVIQCHKNTLKLLTIRVSLGLYKKSALKYEIRLFASNNYEDGNTSRFRVVLLRHYVIQE